MSDSFLTLMRMHSVRGLSWADALSSMALQANIESYRPQIAPGPIHRQANSLPLVAMQLAVDRLRNYTKYCQSCYTKLDKDWRSFKPTVCSRELCLYQQIQIGLTQHLEYEILCQPAVIDLLINLCYVALLSSIGKAESASAIRKYPSGLRLFVPDVDNKHFATSAKLTLSVSTLFFLRKSLPASSPRGNG